MVFSIEDIKSAIDAQRLIDQVLPNYIMWSAVRPPGIYPSGQVADNYKVLVGRAVRSELWLLTKTQQSTSSPRVFPRRL